MNKFPFLVITLFQLFFSYSQNTPTMQDLWGNYSYTPKSVSRFHWHTDTTYAVIQKNKLLQYGVKSQALIDTLFSFPDRSFPIEEYTFDESKSNLLLFTNGTALYRHSEAFDVYVYAKNKLIALPQKKIFNAQFSPNGKFVAYTNENNLFVFDIENESETQITHDGEWNKIINGRADWVNEEEFSYTRAFAWSPKSDKLLYLKFNEEKVEEYNLQVWDDELYPQDYYFKYPKAGTANAEVSVHYYDFFTQTEQLIYQAENSYIPRIYWKNNETAAFQWLNRPQNHWKLLQVSLKDKKTHTVAEERSNTYIEISKVFYVGETVFYTSEKDGYNHIYKIEKGKIHQITKGEWEVSEINFVDTDRKMIYYTSTEFASTERHAFKINFNGRGKICIHTQAGTHRIETNGTYILDYFSSVAEPQIVRLLSADGNELETLENNAELKQKLQEENFVEPQFSTLNANGESLNYFMLKPADFDPNKQYPVLFSIYGGPGVQTVRNAWLGQNYVWYQLLLNQGYIIVSIDGRGTGGKGADFKKCTYGNLGFYESEDLIAAANSFGELPYIDASRIGIWGWSFGGYLSSLCLFKGNDVFKMAIAVAPVTSWRFYDTIYTERYLNTPQNNPEGYDRNSPIYYADRLKGAFLLIHGSGDDNVHLQNTMALQSALIKANKSFQSFIYPDKNHGIYGGNTRMHLYTMMTDFIEKNL